MAKHADAEGLGSAAEESLPKRRPGRPRGSKASEKQKEASRANVKKAAAAKREKKAARDLMRKEPGYKPRWKQVEDGDLDVSQLTTKELTKRAVANDDGSWDGARHPLSSRVVSRMVAEKIKRDRQAIDRLTKKGIRALETRLDDDDAPAQQLAAALRVIEYSIGKVPEVVHIGGETEFDRMKQSAFIVMRGEENVRVDSDDQQDIVEGEIVEETGS